jgi:hypothetical protein
MREFKESSEDQREAKDGVDAAADGATTQPNKTGKVSGEGAVDWPLASGLGMSDSNFL